MQNYTIPAINLGYLKHRIEQLNKRAAKLGLPIIEMKVLGTIMKEVGEAGVPRRFFEISMDGVAPKLPGWTFLGTLEHTDHGNILRSVPGSEIPESYRNAPRKCDHCQKVRNRKDTYVVRNEDGSVKQVGHQCIADYLGNVDPQMLARMASFVRELDEIGKDDEGLGLSLRGSQVTDMLLDALATTYEVIKLEGWTSRSAAKLTDSTVATADHVWNHLHPTSELMRQGFVPVKPSDEAYAFARETVEFLKAREAVGEYENNLRIAAMQEMVEYRGLGIACSMIPFYQKHLAHEAQRAACMKEESGSKHFGEVGKRNVYELIVVGESTFDSQFGITSLYRMRDNGGNVAVWFTGTGSLEVGKTYQMKATIKKHDDYKGTKQTVLTRCSIIEDKKEEIKESA